MEGSAAIEVSYFRVSEPLRPFFTSIYRTLTTSDDGGVITDCIHPEWTSLRFVPTGVPARAGLVGQPRLPRWPFTCTGPTSRCTWIEMGPSQVWGFGILPLGWASCIDSLSSGYTDCMFDGSKDANFSRFAPILAIAEKYSEEPDACASAIEGFLLTLDLQPPRDAQRILACHSAIQDPEVSDVEGMCERINVSRRTLERLCARCFGYSPKQLLRRQRFLRSLSRYAIERQGNWSRAFDDQYFDQAHFVHDFRSYMGVTPSQYATMAHPLLDRVIGYRMADQGIDASGPCRRSRRHDTPSAPTYRLPAE